ncbi:putative PurR-regulated permease PerM [Agromyces flavus]|uniref:PurR-regulated permease PerM n=1 Tax=Agromyces flavus TaxID=589382 RepID=A0A1H1Q4U4_9MICO|nr:AI-2E family transporter [Agromyces flavus]MCP2367802.1 putative PurR-regulated permease PerM [Agromyces flavus]GGI47262.1 AI-2E family transporter [Agromyces flavus]SDS18522.1 Predicted PurR-regulated permease PerM [Agromyces flavus]
MRIQNAFRLALVGTLGVGVGLLILSAVASLSTILTYIGAALFLALGLEPAVSGLERRGLPRWGAIVLVILGVAAVVAALLLAVIPIIVDQVAELIAQVPGIVAQLNRVDWIEWLQEQFPLLKIDEISEQAGAALTDFFTNPDKLSELLGGVWAVALAIGGGVFAVIVVAVLTVYFTASLDAMKRATYQLVPASRRARFADLTEQITQSVGRYVIGQVSLAAVNGFLSFMFLSIIRAPFPAVLAFIAFLFSLVPLVGTLTGSIIIVLLCLIPGLGSPLTGLVAAIYYLIYMQVEAYVLSPRIMSRAVKVPGALVVVAALAGGALLGILGALVAIPIAAAALLIIKQVVIPRQNER